jgi:hypothetical protein
MVEATFLLSPPLLLPKAKWEMCACGFFLQKTINDLKKENKKK